MTRALALASVVLTACFGQPSYRPIDDSPSNPIAFTSLAIAGQPTVIATGGMQIITIPDDPLSVGWSGTASDGYVVEPFGDVWPNTRKAEYYVRALQPVPGTFEIATSHGVAAGTLDSAEVARVALVAACPMVTVELYDASGRRLIDGSLDVAGATRMAWDAFEVAGPSVHLTADSMATQDFMIDCPSDGRATRK